MFLSFAMHIALLDARWLQTVQTCLPVAVVLGASFSAVVHRLGMLDHASGGQQQFGQDREKVGLRNALDGKERS